MRVNHVVGLLPFLWSRTPYFQAEHINVVQGTVRDVNIEVLPTRLSNRIPIHPPLQIRLVVPVEVINQPGIWMQFLGREPVQVRLSQRAARRKRGAIQDVRVLRVSAFGNPTAAPMGPRLAAKIV